MGPRRGLGTLDLFGYSLASSYDYRYVGRRLRHFVPLSIPRTYVILSELLTTNYLYTSLRHGVISHPDQRSYFLQQDPVL